MSAEEMAAEELNQSSGEGRTRKDLLKTAGIVAGAAVAGKLAAADVCVRKRRAAARRRGEQLGEQHRDRADDGGHRLLRPGFKAFKVIAPNFDYGVSGEAKDYGVVGTGAGGVLGLGTVGGVFSGSVVAINLDPQNAAGAPTGEAFKGDLAVDLERRPVALRRRRHAGHVDPRLARRHAAARDAAARLLVDGRRHGRADEPAARRGRSRSRASCRRSAERARRRAQPDRPPDDQRRLRHRLAGRHVAAATSNINWSATGQAVANGATIGVGAGGAVSFYCDGAVNPGPAADADHRRRHRLHPLGASRAGLLRSSGQPVAPTG